MVRSLQGEFRAGKSGTAAGLGGAHPLGDALASAARWGPAGAAGRGPLPTGLLGFGYGKSNARPRGGGRWEVSGVRFYMIASNGAFWPERMDAALAGTVGRAM